jgi:protein gp37
MFDRIAKGLWWDRALRVNSGCTKVSPGCDNCWAESELTIRRKNPDPKISAQWPGDFAGDVHLLESNLEKLLNARTPKVWSVWNDLFHKDVPSEYRDRVLGAFAVSQKQLGIILTKRPDQMAEYFCDIKRQVSIAVAVSLAAYTNIDLGRFWGEAGWPLKKIWLGTSAEDQERADERIHDLLKCPAAVRFLSLEPLLGPVSIEDLIFDFYGNAAKIWRCKKCGWTGHRDELGGGNLSISCPRTGCTSSNGIVGPNERDGLEIIETEPRIGWVIVGAESRGGGIGRECKIEWVRAIVAQCKEASVPVFVKQLHIDGKLVKDIEKFPEDLRLRQVPEFSV